MRCISGWVSAAIQKSISNHTNCSKSCGKFSKISENISKLHLDRKTIFGREVTLRKTTLNEVTLTAKHLLKIYIFASNCQKKYCLHLILWFWLSFFETHLQCLFLLPRNFCLLQAWEVDQHPDSLVFPITYLTVFHVFLALFLHHVFFVKSSFLWTLPHVFRFYILKVFHSFCFFLKDFLIPSFGKHSL